jgi:hypothetical protein
VQETWEAGDRSHPLSRTHTIYGHELPRRRSIPLPSANHLMASFLYNPLHRCMYTHAFISLLAPTSSPPPERETATVRHVHSTDANPPPPLDTVVATAPEDVEHAVGRRREAH